MQRLPVRCADITAHDLKSFRMDEKKEQDEILCRTRHMEVLFRTYHPRLHYYAASLVDESVAEELVQDVFLKIWDEIRLDASPETLKSFLYTSVRNHCLNFIRKKKPLQVSLGDSSDIQEPTYSKLENIIEAEVLGDLHAAIAQLPSECRKIVELGFLKEYSNLEIANSLGLSVQTVKNQKTRGLKILRGLLQNKVWSFFL